MATSPRLGTRRPLDRSLRAFMQQLVRPPSPDSACEQDDAWSPPGGNGKASRKIQFHPEEGQRKAGDGILMVDDAQSESSDSGNAASATSTSSDGTATGNYHTHLNHNHDSDGDSGIDSVERFSQRIGSTSSADTDGCQELERKPTSDPALFPEFIKRPHNDDGHSEENMRHSCRKLLAALYATPNSADAKGAYRYRSFSMPNTTEHQLAVKRLSVPTSAPGASHIQNGLSRPVNSHDITLNDGLLKCQDARERCSSFGTAESSAQRPQKLSHSPLFTPKLSLHPMPSTCRTQKGSINNASSVSAAFPYTRTVGWSGSHQVSSMVSPKNVASPTVLKTTMPTASDPSTIPSSGDCKTPKDVTDHAELRPKENACPSTLILTSPKKTSSQQNISPKDDTVFPPREAALSLPLPENCVDKCVLKQDDVLRVYARPASVVPEPQKLAVSEFSERCCRDRTGSGSKTATVRASSNWNVSGRQQVSTQCKNRSCMSSENLSQRRVVVPGHYSPRTCSTANLSCLAVKTHNVNHEADDVEGTRAEHGSQTSTSQKCTSMPALSHQQGTPVKGTQKVLQGGVEYAVVRRKQEQHMALSAIPRITSTPCIMVDDREPPLPPKSFVHKSNFSLYRGSTSSCSLSTVTSAPSSPSSLLGRVQGLGRTAKSALIKAFSTERIYRPQKTESAAARVHVNVDPHPANKQDSSTSLVKGLKNRISLRRKSKRRSHQEASIQINAAESGCDPIWAGGQPTHVSGQLLQLNLDGSQVVELRRPPGRSFGFFLARGRVHTHQGVFVSRMHDAHTQQVLQGLLDVGDEILEVNGNDVRDADIMQVNALMAHQNTLLLTVLPYICRKDI